MGFLPSVFAWRLARPSWPMSPHASHLMLPSCPPLPPSHGHLNFALFFLYNFKLFTFPSFYLGQLTRVPGDPIGTVLPQPTFCFVLSPRRTRDVLLNSLMSQSFLFY